MTSATGTNSSLRAFDGLGQSSVHPDRLVPSGDMDSHSLRHWTTAFICDFLSIEFCMATAVVEQHLSLVLLHWKCAALFQYGFWSPLFSLIQPVMCKSVERKHALEKHRCHYFDDVFFPIKDWTLVLSVDLLWQLCRIVNEREYFFPYSAQFFENALPRFGSDSFRLW